MGCNDFFIEQVVPNVMSPGQYAGAEWNMARKDPARVALRFCLAFPDTYSVGMSYPGLHVLYGLLNRREDTYAERVFTPWLDMQDLLRARQEPLRSLETQTPLREFDAVGFSLQYEMCYTNVLDILELGGIPVLAAERKATDPLIVAGGGCALSPEPMADFIDLFVLGDGEDRVPDLADALIALKRNRPATRQEMLVEIVRRVPNSYAPALYEVEWTSDGRIAAIHPKAGLEGVVPARVEAAMVRDFENAYAPERPIVPFAEIIQDRISVEIMRGCARGCRFCNAGMTRRPVRRRSVERILSICEAQYAATGHSEISLASLSSSDYPDLAGLVGRVSRQFADRRVSVNLPSLRVDDQLTQIPGLVNAVRKSTLTIAPEAATERLRGVINKDIREDDLYRGVEAAFAQGWNHIKLYFMVGLPTETDEDVVEIARMAERVSGLRRRHARGPALVNASVAVFVPKAHTPFQWEPMARMDRVEEIRRMLYASVRQRSVKIRMHHAERSLLEAAFARGDRRLGAVILAAHRKGCRLDAWDEIFDIIKWREAFDEAGLSAEDYAYRARAEDEVLPWSHLGAGVSTEFLKRELERSRRGEFTTDCRQGVCQTCGIPECPEQVQG